MIGLKNVVHHHTPRRQLAMRATKRLKNLFAPGEKDDSWLTFVGEKGWIVLTQDRKFHKEGFENELSAIKQFRVGCFYIWGAEATKWEKLRAFCRAFDNVKRAIENTPRPFIFDVTKAGKLRQITIP